MKLSIGSKNLSMTTELRDYAEKRLAKVDKHLRLDTNVNLIVRQGSAKSKDQKFTAEVTIKTKNGFVRAEEQAATPEAAIDLAEEVVIRQLHRIKTKRQRLRKKGGIFDMAEISDAVEETGETLLELPFGQLVRKKEHVIEPMHVEEATAQMELLGHTFFMFREADSEKISVVYRRSDGDYGMIVPA